MHFVDRLAPGTLLGANSQFGAWCDETTIVLVDADTGEVIKFERKSMMDLIKKK